MVARSKGHAPADSHAGNGFCQRCYRARRTALDRPKDRPRQWKALELLAEYEFWLTQGLKTKRQVAERIGVTFVALDRAIYRGRAYRRRMAEVGPAGGGVEDEAA